MDCLLTKSALHRHVGDGAHQLVPFRVETDGSGPDRNEASAQRTLLVPMRVHVGGQPVS